ncbi:MAG: DUF1905 domain-containing protein [Minisyncoccia bacterium]
MSKVFKFRGEVWRWPGQSGWHFVNLPKSISEKIKKECKPHGFGFIKTEAKLGGSVWMTALFPDKKSGTFLLSIKAKIRKTECIWESDKVNITIKV